MPISFNMEGGLGSLHIVGQAAQGSSGPGPSQFSSGFKTHGTYNYGLTCLVQGIDLN